MPNLKKLIGHTVRLHNLSLKPSILTLIPVLMLSLFLLSSTYAADVPEPQKLMEETSQKLIKQFMAQTESIRKDANLAHQLINDSLVPKINFSLMSRWVLGKNWRQATTQQKKDFIKEFKELVIKFYSKALIQYLDKNDLKEDIITFLPFRGKIKSKYATIRSQVNPPNGGAPVKVNYDLYHTNEKTWQVYDVSVEGISLVTSYRSSFKQIISQKGMDALLTELRNKNANLSSDIKQT